MPPSTARVSGRALTLPSTPGPPLSSWLDPPSGFVYQVLSMRELQRQRAIEKEIEEGQARIDETMAGLTEIVRTWAAEGQPPTPPSMGFKAAGAVARAEFERAYWLNLATLCGGNISYMARLADMGRAAVRTNLATHAPSVPLSEAPGANDNAPPPANGQPIGAKQVRYRVVQFGNELLRLIRYVESKKERLASVLRKMQRPGPGAAAAPKPNAESPAPIARESQPTPPEATPIALAPQPVRTTPPIASERRAVEDAAPPVAHAERPPRRTPSPKPTPKNPTRKQTELRRSAILAVMNARPRSTFTARRLASALGIPPDAVSEALAFLEENELVRRLRSGEYQAAPAPAASRGRPSKRAKARAPSPARMNRPSSRAMRSSTEADKPPAKGVVPARASR